MRIAFLDFEQSSFTALADGNTLSFHQTGWNGGAPPLTFDRPDLVFINADYKDTDSALLHASEYRQLLPLIETGTAVFSFIGKCAAFHLTNLIGLPISLQSLGTVVSQVNPKSCRIENSSPLDIVFSLHGNHITGTRFISGAEIALASNSGHTVAASIKRGQGMSVYLPHFGTRTALVVRTIVDSVVPNLLPHLFFDDRFSWLDDPQYLVPSLLSIRRRHEETQRAYETTLLDLKREYESEYSATQAKLNRLLTSTGDELKLAVKDALEKLGWQAVDVDAHWEAELSAGRLKEARQKEEDLWMACQTTPHPSQQGVALVEVKGKVRGTASEDDYGAVIKYLNRRKTEFSNPSLTGMIVINHSYMMAPATRPAAYARSIVDDALRDRVVLATTWDLFRLVQGTLAGTIADHAIQALLSTPGVVEFGLE